MSRRRVFRLGGAAAHISRVPHSLPPYALAVPIFRFPHLANLAGRAPIGGVREVALACFVGARLAAECLGPAPEDPSGRAARCAGAKAWLGTLALPQAVRMPAVQCADSSVSAGRAAMGRDLAALAAAAASFLDVQSKAELDTLTVALKS